MIKLKPGWTFDASTSAIKRQGRAIRPELPQGMTLVPALVMPPARPGRSTPAERELARFVHLSVRDESALEDALAMVRGWPFVERAEWPLNPG